MFSQNIFFTV